MNFEQLLTQRRSVYEINSQIPISQTEVENLLSVALKYCPTAFNSQLGRIVLLTQKKHQKLWQITSNKIKQSTTPEQFSKSQSKIESFAAGYGTILFFTDNNITQELQTRFPLYADNFPTWAEHAQGMLQFIVWTLLTEHNIGASLQHYTPLISQSVQQEFNITDSWKLSAQMPFGGITSAPSDKTFLPLSDRLKIFRN